jgi:hypothetical protein
MLRATVVFVLGVLLFCAVGCDEGSAPLTASPAAPDSGAASLNPTAGPPPSNQTTPVAPTPAAAPAGGPTGASAITLEAAFAGLDSASKRLCELFDSIQDDASATAAAPQIAAAGRDVAAGMKQFKTAVAALSLAGQDDEISKFTNKVAQRGESPQGSLIDKLERVVNSPQYPLVRNEINGVLDGMLEAATIGDRRGLQHAIEQKKLRR